MNFIKKIFGIKKYTANNFSGKGFIQGTGFDIETEILEILGIKFITDITISSQSQWLRDLKNRWKEDDQQQKLEKKINEKNIS